MPGPLGLLTSSRAACSRAAWPLAALQLCNAIGRLLKACRPPQGVDERLHQPADGRVCMRAHNTPTLHSRPLFAA